MTDKLSEKRVIPRPFAVTQDVFELEENTVTVTKHETALEDTAMAISVVTGDMVNEQGRSDILDVLKDTPGLTIDQSSQGKILIFAVSAVPSLLPKASVILMWR